MFGPDPATARVSRCAQPQREGEMGNVQWPPVAVPLAAAPPPPPPPPPAPPLPFEAPSASAAAVAAAESAVPIAVSAVEQSVHAACWPWSRFSGSEAIPATWADFRGDAIASP